MKKLVFSICMLLGGIAVVNAQDTTATDKSQSNQYSQSTQASTQDDDRVRIQSQDLPDQVKRSLEGQEYRGWLVNGAYKSKGVSSMDASGSTGSASGTSSESTTGSTSGSSTGSTGSTSGSASGTTGTTSDPSTTSGSTSTTSAAGQEIFVVELKNGAQTKTVRFDKDGKKLDDMGTESSEQK